MLKELKNAGYYVWANARNDLIAAQIDGLIEDHVTELYYGGNIPPAPGFVDPAPRGKPGDPQFYSFCNGELQLDANGLNYTADDEDIDAACERILHPVDDRPLCLFVGMLYPHPPYNVEEPYFSDIDRQKLPERLRYNDCTGKSRMNSLLRQYQNLTGMTDEQWNELRAIYLGMCTKVDRMFARIIDALKQAGQYDNTLIVFLSDHGDYAGDYDLIEKAQNCFEDVLTRVPLLVKPPKGSPLDAGVCDSLVELVDLYATVMDYAGVQPDHSHFGRSLAPLIADRSNSIRTEVFCEGGRNPDEVHCSESVDPAVVNGFRYSVMWPRYAAQHDNAAHAKGAMVRTKDWKYIYRAQGDSELYDLNADPHEQHNLIWEERCTPIQAQLQQKLLAWYQETADTVPYARDDRFSKKMVWEKVKLQCPAEHEAMVKEKIDAGMSLFPAIALCKELREQSKP